jgi:hypothetical protein
MSKRRVSLTSPQLAAAADFSVRALLLPLAFIAALGAFVLLPRIANFPPLLQAFAWSAGALFAWLAVLFVAARASGRRLQWIVDLRPQHYLQAIAHTAIFVYWAIYWPDLRAAAPLIAGQIVFAYALDMLLTWSRRDTYALGFGPFPIIYSTNLFLRFRDDWFAWQFAMVAIGFLAKELIRWNRNGRRVHIFNPSSFPLALFSLGLIATGQTNLTWGYEIATLLILPPQMYLFIFLVALPGQFKFGVTTMTLPAVLTTYAISTAYFAITGSYFFFDSNIPIAVFLGMHLLFTDPSTSPRTELGRILFGVCYGASVVVLHVLLEAAGAPTFYDKLLQVPLMNLGVKQFDQAAQWLVALVRAPGPAAAPSSLRRLAYTGVWIVAFGAMSAANGVGDDHPGRTLLFWNAACEDGRFNGCRNLAQVETRFCNGGSGWACNELALLGMSKRAVTPPAADLFEFGCVTGFAQACENMELLKSGAAEFRRGDPRLEDFRHILQEGRGPIPGDRPQDVYALACRKGWVSGCTDLGFALVSVDRSQASRLWEDACAKQHAPACVNLGVMYRQGDGVAVDEAKAAGYLRQACDLEFERACGMLNELKPAPPQLQ